MTAGKTRHVGKAGRTRPSDATSAEPPAAQRQNTLAAFFAQAPQQTARLDVSETELDRRAVISQLPTAPDWFATNPTAATAVEITADIAPEVLAAVRAEAARDLISQVPTERPSSPPAPSATGRETSYPESVGSHGTWRATPPARFPADDAPRASDLFLDSDISSAFTALPDLSHWPQQPIVDRAAERAQQIIGAARRSTPTPQAGPQATPPRSTVSEHTDPRQRALLKHALPYPPETDAEAARMLQDRDIVNHLYWWQQSLRHQFWAMSHWKIDNDLCARCGHKTGEPRSITASLPHEAFVWLCAPCQTCIYRMAAERAMLKGTPGDVRPQIELILLAEKNIRTYHPSPKLTLPMPPTGEG